MEAAAQHLRLKASTLHLCAYRFTIAVPTARMDALWPSAVSPGHEGRGNCSWAVEIHFARSMRRWGTLNPGLDPDRMYDSRQPYENVETAKPSQLHGNCVPQPDKTLEPSFRHRPPDIDNPTLLHNSHKCRRMPICIITVSAYMHPPRLQSTRGPYSRLCAHYAFIHRRLTCLNTCKYFKPYKLTQSEA